MGLYRRFFSYYRPHMGLFVLDMVVAVISSFLSVLFPLLTNYLLDGPVADGNVRLMIAVFSVMLAVYVFQAVSTYSSTISRTSRSATSTGPRRERS